ncbi:MAG: type II CRISPR RNA-guided endonuclease Cas9 [Mycoplasma sp.]
MVKNNENKTKVVLGLDLGTAWHGWALCKIDETEESKNEIIKRGSHYFGQQSDPQSGKYKQGTCGEQRRNRRTIKRRKQRKLDFKTLVNKNKNIFNFDINELVSKITINIYEVAVKGLTQELSKEELIQLLYVKLTNRGSQYNIPNLTMKTISENLLEIFNQNQKVRGVDAKTFSTRVVDHTTGEVKDNAIINFQFSRKDLSKELETILNNCSYLKNSTFKEDYLNIFDRQRHFSKGPGSEKSLTQWGVYKTDGTIVENLWDTQIKKCCVNKELPVAFKGLPSGEIANMVSQLSFLRKNNNFLTREEKVLFWNNIFTKQTKPTLKNIAKIFEVETSELSRFPVKKDGNDSFEELKITRNLLNNKIIIANDFYDLLTKLEEYEIIADKIYNNFFQFDKEDESLKLNNYNVDLKSSKEILKELDTNNIIVNIDNFLNFTTIKDINDNRWGFSSKALINYVNENWNKEVSSQLGNFYQKEKLNSDNAEYMIFKRGNVNQEIKYINEGLFDGKPFLSPDIKNASKEAIKLINKTLKYCSENNFYLSDIVLETTRDDRHSFLTQKQIAEKIKEQLLLEKITKSIKDLVNDDSIVYKIKTLALSFGADEKTWRNMNYFDLYTAQPIFIEDIINNNQNFEVDHILPISNSANNKQTNKLLVYRTSNQEKGDRTASVFVGKNEKVLNLWEDSIKKVNYELYKNLKMDFIPKGFLNSQLCNVSNIMRQIQQGLKCWTSYCTENNKQFNGIEIHTVSGTTTQKIRELSGLETKTRDDNEHHSVDASICAIIGSLEEFKKLIPQRDEFGRVIFSTKLNLFNKENITKYKTIVKTIETIDWDLTSKRFTRFWDNQTLEQKIELLKKDNSGSKTNETLYGKVFVDQKLHQKIKLKFGDFEKQEKNFKKLFDKEYKDSKCLSTKIEFEKTKEIYKQFSNEKNPFVAYKIETLKNNPDWRKYFVDGKIPYIYNNRIWTIKGLTIIGDKVKSCIDIPIVNGFKTGSVTKAVLIVKTIVNGKEKIRFEKLDTMNSFFKNNKDLLESGEMEIIDIIEVGQLYYQEGIKELWRVSGVHINRGLLLLEPINDKNNLSFEKSFEKMKQTELIKK